MKKYLLILLGVVLLTACGSDDQASTSENKKDLQAVEEEDQRVPNEDLNNDNQLDQAEDDEDLEEDEDLDQEDEEESDEETVDIDSEEYLANLVEESDYIISLEMTQTGSDGVEYNIIEEYKGSFSNIKIPKISGLKANTEYLVFMKDDENGDIVYTDQDNSLIAYEDDDQIIERIESILGLVEDQEEDQSNEESQA